MNMGRGSPGTLGDAQASEPRVVVEDRAMVLGLASRLRPVASTGRVAGDSGVLRQAVPRETVKLGLP